MDDDWLEKAEHFSEPEPWEHLDDLAVVDRERETWASWRARVVPGPEVTAVS